MKGARLLMNGDYDRRWLHLFTFLVWRELEPWRRNKKRGVLDFEMCGLAVSPISTPIPGHGKFGMWFLLLTFHSHILITDLGVVAGEENAFARRSMDQMALYLSHYARAIALQAG